MDPFGRHIDYLRISVTDRCNERCLYCMPQGLRDWKERDEILTVLAQGAGLLWVAGQLQQPLRHAGRIGGAHHVAGLPVCHQISVATHGRDLFTARRIRGKV